LKGPAALLVASIAPVIFEEDWTGSVSASQPAPPHSARVVAIECLSPDWMAGGRKERSLSDGLAADRFDRRR
jgi:hypothetical protein